MDKKEALVINITIHGWVLALVGLAVFAAIVAFSASSARGKGQPAPAESTAGSLASTGAGRHFYLTKSYNRPSQAPTACASGYHMASLWEIYDPSSLIYSHDHPDAFTYGDSGYGPPSSWTAWIRTGYSSSSTGVSGRANCNNWTVDVSQIEGTNYWGSTATLSGDWIASPGDMGPWAAGYMLCGNQNRVWCVED